MMALLWWRAKLSCMVHNYVTLHMLPQGALTNVSAEDILLAPNTIGRIKVNAPISPVTGDLVLEPERRVVVEKLVGPVASLLLRNTQLEIANSIGDVNVVSTLNETAAAGIGVVGALSLSNAVFIGGMGQNSTISLAGPLKMNNNKIFGQPLELIAQVTSLRFLHDQQLCGQLPLQAVIIATTTTLTLSCFFVQNGTDLTLSAEIGSVVVPSPMKLSGPIVPANAGLLQVQLHNFTLFCTHTISCQKCPVLVLVF